MSQVVVLRWHTKTWCVSFFYNSCHTWFIKLIEGDEKGKPSGFYWHRQKRHSTHDRVMITFVDLSMLDCCN